MLSRKYGTIESRDGDKRLGHGNATHAVSVTCCIEGNNVQRQRSHRVFSGGVVSGDAIPQSTRTTVGNGRSTITGVAVEKMVLGLEGRVVQFPWRQFGGLTETLVKLCCILFLPK